METTKSVFGQSNSCLSLAKRRGEEIMGSPRPRSGNWMVDGVSREADHDSASQVMPRVQIRCGG